MITNLPIKNCFHFTSNIDTNCSLQCLFHDYKKALDIVKILKKQFINDFIYIYMN